LDCEVLTGAAFNQRYPHYNLPPTWSVAYQKRSGFVRPDATRTFLHQMATASGANVLHNTRVIDVDARATRVTIGTQREPITGDFLIVAAGSWLPKLLPELDLSLSAERRVLAWFEPQQSEALDDGRLPIFCMDSDGGWYGMPTPEGKLKLGHDKHLGQRVDPDQGTTAPGEADAARLTPCVDRYFKGFNPQPSAMKTCIYTITPDHHFIIDRHPANANVILFSCCSGHGFKYAPEYGKIALDMVRGKPRPDLDQFRLNRGGSAITRFGD
jgi:sarcosine oxidase